MLTPSCDEFASEVPFYFVRGNHETRGKFCRNLHHYFSNPNEQQYYEFTWGSTHFTVINKGEDKPDNTEVYADIVAFDSYRMEQLQWFKMITSSNDFKKVSFRVVFMHIPMYYSGDWHGTMHLRKLFSAAFNLANIDICISGHTHSHGVHKPKKEEHNYPIIIGGGPKEGQRTAILLKTTKKTLTLNMLEVDVQIKITERVKRHFIFFLFDC